MNTVDVVLVVALGLMVLTGWRQGLIAGLLSFAGFLGGAVAALVILPWGLDSLGISGVAQTLALVFGVVAAALGGHALASAAGRRVRESVTWRPAAVADHAGGALLQVTALAAVAWIVASALALVPGTTLARSVRQSSVLAGIDRIVPDPARDAVTGLRSLVGSTDLPRAFAGLAEALGPDVGEPDPTSLEGRGVRRALGSVVRVAGAAEACGTELTGSGFVYAPERVLTNAHVVAGVEEPTVQVRAVGDLMPARVVAFDPDLDLAILLVPGLSSPALGLSAGPARSGDPAVVAGFPGGGPLEVSPARVRGEITARGEDIYGRAGVVREVYSFRGTVVPGNSGGPLLTPRGRVLGVVFASALGDSTTGYAITTAEIAALADEGRDARAAVDSGRCRSR